MLSVKKLYKTYKLNKKKDGSGEEKVVKALNGVTIDFPETGMVFLLGKSGSGKSTLLNCIGGLDTFDDGEIIIKGRSSKTFKQSDFDSYRNTFIGFIFQEYNILEEFTIGKNLALALELQGKKADKDVVNKLLDEVDLHGYYKRKPNQLSGGQKQRVAIARALIKEPEIIMADEPTGALDSNTGRQVMDTLKKLSKTKLVIVVSHDREFAEIYGDRVIELKDGRVISDETKNLVEAQKSESGVSFLDDKLVHIKKGQSLSVKDFDKISKMIIENSRENDVIISFDKKANEQVKKTSFITEDGNREVFKPTTVVLQKKYDPKKFKLIKSRLKFKDALKMGAGSLKHKPIRLVFTILLAVVAFGLFGLVDTFASFNSVNSLYETMQAEKYSAISIRKEVKEDSDGDYTYYYEENMTAEDIADLEDRAGGEYDIYPVIADTQNYGGSNFDIEGLSKKSNSYDYRSNYIVDTVFSGYLGIDTDIQTKLNLKLVEGTLPKENDQICISKNVFENIKYFYNADNFSQIDGTKTNVRFSSFKGLFKIVGVLEDAYDVSKLRESKDDNFLQQYTTSFTAQYGLTNMVYITAAKFDELNSAFVNYRIRDSFDNYCYASYFSTPSGFLNNNSNSKIYYKTGFTSADKDWIVLPESKLAEILDLNEYSSEFYDGETGMVDEQKWTAALLAGLDKGLSINYYNDNTNALVTTLKVAGFVTDAYYSTLIVSEETLNKYFKVSKDDVPYALLSLKQTNKDKTVLKALLTAKNGVRYAIQTPAAKEIDNFGSMITSMSQIFLYVGIGLAVFASLMLMNFISTSIAYKRREIGVFRAIGARGKDVFAIFFLEALIICLINFVLATIGCAIAAFFINKSVIGAGISMTLLTFSFRQVVLILGVSVLAAFISSFLPVYRIAKKNPIDSINGR